MSSERSSDDVRKMIRGFSDDARKTLRAAFRNGDPLVCPTCRVELTEQRFLWGPEVSYVRRRHVVVCPGCRAHLVLDAREDA